MEVLVRHLYETSAGPPTRDTTYRDLFSNKKSY